MMTHTIRPNRGDGIFSNSNNQKPFRSSNYLTITATHFFSSVRPLSLDFSLQAHIQIQLSILPNPIKGSQILTNNTRPPLYTCSTTFKMSEEWDSVTRIGKKSGHNASGGGGDFERVVKSQSQLNAMKRSGAAISTEKKFGGSNSVSLTNLEELTSASKSMPADKI